MTAAYLASHHAFVGHIGDSRAYLFRHGELAQLTRDHTLAQDLIDAGADRDRTSGYQHLLTNCLGGTKDKVKVEIHQLRMLDGDRLLLCSDGLTDMVSDETIAKTLDELPVAQESCDRLIQLALDNGGRDNVTVVIAGIELD